ncbi:antigen peptide transporter 1 [Takifugu flavidus]|uniref:Antigen peptide transporter 1 n=1 Tax=Takifugu flavidus TaxID=433684 RepID=A0A5C6PNS4_9TELE|nr:antigen peptide transporter 1 [Takifugu flavidus]TWW79997.1 Antigen peptide transporter 1 [Takifugu flavidus]
MWKMTTTSLFPLFFVCLDVCAVQVIHLAQESLFNMSHSLAGLLGASVARACLLAALALKCPSGLSQMSSSERLHSILVLCFHFPVYTALLSVLGQPNLEQLWGWHSWERVLYGYVITLLAWLYWSHYVSSLLLSCCKCVSTLLSRTTSEEPKVDTIAPLRRLYTFTRPYLWRFAAVLLLVILSSYGEMALPQYTGRVTDWIAKEEAPEAFTNAITVMAILTIAGALFEFLCDLIYNITTTSIHSTVQELVFEAVLKQELAFFDSRKPGELVSHITTSTNKMSEILSQELSYLMWYISRFAFLMFFMVNQSWKMLLLTWMGLPICWVIAEFTGNFQQSISRELQNALGEANQVATETFSHIKTVKSFANEDGETEKYRCRLDDIYRLNKMESGAYAFSMWSSTLSSLAMKVCVLYYGGILVTRGGISSGDLVSFILYELQFSSAVESVMTSYPKVREAIGASEKSFEYLDRKPDLPPDGHLNPQHLDGCIEFKNVTFSYSGKSDNLVLKDVSFKLKPGRITALVGSNSTGKSTCVKLLERFYQPQAGEILLDGKPLHHYRDQYLHEKIAVVSQDCVLFARPIRENIKYGYEDASDEEMYAAARLAGAHEFITKLMNGYDTDAGERGGQVSGGQKQRIAIARALIRRPKILILDSATSDLDSQTEYLVTQALFQQIHCTVLLISRNMSVVEKADHIVVLGDGTVKEEGSHTELMAKGSFYTELVRTENKSFHRQEEQE